MLLNLNDPESILDWWKVFPARHASFLDYKLRVSPEFAPAIREAQRRISNSPALSGLLADAVQQHRQHEASQAAHDDNVSAYELRHREFAAA